MLLITDKMAALDPIGTPGFAGQMRAFPRRRPDPRPVFASDIVIKEIAGQDKDFLPDTLMDTFCVKTLDHDLFMSRAAVCSKAHINQFLAGGDNTISGSSLTLQCSVGNKSTGLRVSNDHK